MENIYQLVGQAAELAVRFNEIQDEFEALMEENGGELNEESQEYLDKMEELQALRAKMREDILENADAYAAWYKNEEAQKKADEAALKAFKEAQQVAVAKYETAVRKRENRCAWIKDSISFAMDWAEVDKLDKKTRPDAKFSLYFQNTKSIDVDETLALAQYEEEISAFLANLPEWLSFVPKFDKKALKDVEVLPEGFERRISRSLQIR